MTTLDFDSARRDWWHSSACADADPDLFFPAVENRSTRAQIATAKAFCTGCPVREECLRWALSRGKTAGIWGGLSENERTALARREAELAKHQRNPSADSGGRRGIRTRNGRSRP
jgi:WhiB family transcriptional regulator, redox-sensing transcriptional regulator